MKICKKIRLSVAGDKDEKKRVYSYISNGQYAQYQGLNILMGTLASKFYECGKDFNNPEFIAFRKAMFRKDSMDKLLSGIEFAVGADTKSAITQTVRQDFNASIKNGIARGERSVTNYKRTYPLILRGRDIHLCHEYSSEEEFLEHLKHGQCDLYLKTVNKIKFKVVLGSLRNTGDRILRETLKYVVDGTYRICSSKIMIDDNQKIIMILTIDKPDTDSSPDVNRCMAVKLGEYVTANVYIDKKNYDLIGNAEEMQRMKTMIAKRRAAHYSSMRYSKGGHGRAKKMNVLNRLQKRESGFAKNYNHNISREIVNYAIENNCGVIILEDLKAYDTKVSKSSSKNEEEKNLFPYMKWTYFQLQQMIEYKAAMSNIQVFKIPVILKEYEGLTEIQIAAAMLTGRNDKDSKKGSTGRKKKEDK